MALRLRRLASLNELHNLLPQSTAFRDRLRSINDLKTRRFGEFLNNAAE